MNAEEQNNFGKAGDPTPADAQELQARVSDLETQLAECTAKRDEYLAGWQRERADLQNARRDMERRLQEAIEYRTSQFIVEVLPVLDSFGMALDFMRAQTEERGRSPVESGTESRTSGLAEGWIHGTKQIQMQLLDILKRQGVEVIKSEGELFNPTVHEAMEEVESDQPQGTVVEELQRGYVMNGKTIRPARVRVAKAKQQPSDTAQGRESGGKG